MEQLLNRTEVNPESRSDTPYWWGGNPSYVYLSLYRGVIF